MIHDLVLGDFGRSGLIRYFKYFSEMESEILKKKSGRSDVFDEERKINITLVTNTTFFKKFIINSNANIHDIPIEKLLIGNTNGPDPQKLIQPFVSLIVDYVKVIKVYEPEKVRIIIPCNTLGGIINNLRDELKKQELGVAWEIPNIVNIVSKYLYEKQIMNIAIWSTQIAYNEYEAELLKYNDKIKIRLIKDKANLFKIKESVSFNNSQNLNFEKSISDQMLCACTDIESNAKFDSTKIFVSHLLSEIYKNEY